MLAIENNPPSAGLNGEPYAVRNEEPGPPRVALALQAIDRAARNARTVRALEKAIAREEREQDEKMALFDDLERYITSMSWPAWRTKLERMAHR